MSEGPLFILAGNGAYLNRGCEAIARGTVRALRAQYRDPRFLSISFFNFREELEGQRRNEIDGGIEHLSCFHPNRKDTIASLYSPRTWRYVYRSLADERRLGLSIYRDMMPCLPEAKAVLSIAADNYSLYHGTARLFTALDDVVLDGGRPLILWGGSVGPFDRDPGFEAYMSGHLRRATGIFARESATVGYLRSIGVASNVHLSADPAFLMDAVRPPGIENELPMDGEAIGLNFSDRVAKRAAGGNGEGWTRMVADIISTVAKRTEMPVYLIPHGTRSCSDDHAFMGRALDMAENKDNVTLVPPKYNAAETKWIIGRMTAFAGVRTHAAIAALSSLVPTLSLSYGMKTEGMNGDIFGHTRHCLGPAEFNAAAVAARLTSMLDEREQIRDQLVRQIPIVVGRTMDAAAEMRQMLGD